MTDDKYDLSPDKVKMFKSQSQDLFKQDAVKELIDNAIDNWGRITDRTEPAKVDIDIEPKKIRVKDNTGGIPDEKIEKVFSQGETLKNTPEWSIGGYALGAKKAITKLGGLGEGAFDEAKISSRSRDSSDTYGYTIDRSWFQDEDKWKVERQIYNNLQKGESELVIRTTEKLWNQEDIDDLRKDLRKTYKKFLEESAQEQSAQFNIILNGDPVQPPESIEWTYIPISDLYPRKYKNIQINPKYNLNEIRMEIEVGLMLEENSQMAGTDMYFQDRLVLRADTSEEGGFGTGETAIGQFTSKHDRLKARVEVFTRGDASNLPWDTQKKSVEPDRDIYPKIIEFVKPYFNADSSLVSDNIAHSYDQDSNYAANNGEIKEIDVSDTESNKPEKNLSSLNKLLDIVGYHINNGSYINFNNYPHDSSKYISKNWVPAYMNHIKEQSTKDLEPIPPERGDKIVDDVRELQKEIKQVRQVGDNKFETILDGVLNRGCTSLKDVKKLGQSGLENIDGVGGGTAKNILEHIEPKEGIEETLQELSACLQGDSDKPDKNRVFELYQDILDYDTLPTRNEIKTVKENVFPILTTNDKFCKASNVYIPDDDIPMDKFDNATNIYFAQLSSQEEKKLEQFELPENKLVELMDRLGAKRVSDAINKNVFIENSISEFDPTPRERLEEAWDSIENSLGLSRWEHTYCPSINWVTKTGIEYVLEGESVKIESSCEYDSKTNTIHLTPDFHVNWDALANEILKIHNGNKEKIKLLLRQATDNLEDQAVDALRQHEKEHIEGCDIVKDVRNQDILKKDDIDGVDTPINVRGIDILAIRNDNEPRYIEVKARSSRQTSVRLVGKEPEAAERLGDRFFLYVTVIDRETDSIDLWRISNPAECDGVNEETCLRIKQSTWHSGEKVDLR